MDVLEFSSFFGLHNFELEFYEETADGSGEYVQILDRQKILEYFTVTLDEQARDPNSSERERNRSSFSR